MAIEVATRIASDRSKEELKTALRKAIERGQPQVAKKAIWALVADIPSKEGMDGMVGAGSMGGGAYAGGADGVRFDEYAPELIEAIKSDHDQVATEARNALIQLGNLAKPAVAPLILFCLIRTSSCHTSSSFLS